MAPPSYSDIGKSARDVLGKGYHLNTWKLEAKTATSAGLKFKTTGVHNTDNGKVMAVLESEYAVKDYGLKFVEKWSTDNVISMETSVENQGLEGLKVTLDGSFNPSSGNKRGQLKTNYKCDWTNINLDVDSAGGPAIRGAAVLGYKGWLAGYQMGFDVAKSTLTNNNFAVGLEGKDYALHANVNDGQEFSGSVHHRVNRALETGLTLGWSAGSNATAFNFGAKYNVSDDTNVRMKVSNQSQLGLSLQQKLKDGLSLTLSAMVDGKNFSAGNHRVGLAVEFEQ